MRKHNYDIIIERIIIIIKIKYFFKNSRKREE